MRDPNRIDPLLKHISRIWKKNPDLRLTQLIRVVCADHAQDDLFYVEDNRLEVAFLKFEREQ